MTTTTAKTRKPTEITSPVVYRVNDKVTGQCLGYLVPSDQAGVDPYRITFNFEAHRYECNCKCGKEHDHAVTCKHIRAVNSTVAARKEFHQQEITSPAPEPVETHRVSCVHGAGGTAWYPEYLENGQWFRYPLEGMTHSVHFLDESPVRAQTWLAERIASVAEQEAERKMDAFKRGMDEQYASDPRTEMVKRIADEETRASNLRAFYNGL